MRARLNPVLPGLSKLALKFPHVGQEVAFYIVRVMIPVLF
jgi:hypothetical protein